MGQWTDRPSQPSAVLLKREPKQFGHRYGMMPCKIALRFRCAYKVVPYAGRGFSIVDDVIFHFSQLKIHPTKFGIERQIET